MNRFKVGHIVRLQWDFRGQAAGTLCFVYEATKIKNWHYISIMTHHEIDMGAFDEKQQRKLKWIGRLDVKFMYVNDRLLFTAWHTRIKPEFDKFLKENNERIKNM